MANVEIFPPCGIKIGQKEPVEFICPAIFFTGEPPGNLEIDSINRFACDSFVEDKSCPWLQSVESDSDLNIIY